VAGLTAFAYIPVKGVLHRIDPRFKLVNMVLFSAAVMQAGPVMQAVLSALVLALTVAGRLPLRTGLREIRHVGWLLLLVLAARALSVPGPPLTVAGLTLPVTIDGLGQGAVICWQLAIIFFMGWVLVASTRPTEIKAAATRLLKPVPLVPEQRVGVMLGLILRLIPMVMDQAVLTMAAQRARCVENRRNPVGRMVRFAVPYFRRLFTSADRLALAMDARCYSEDRTDPALKAGAGDWIALLTAAVSLAASLLL